MPISLSGSEFQQSVYRQLINIPYGETRSYSDIAEAIGNKKAVREMGNPNSKNPHRDRCALSSCDRTRRLLDRFCRGIEAKKILLRFENAGAKI
ncbi:MAG: hypothetical protein Ct9H90mP27_1780 [Gammaproteobacteria bacterium]|nr:MAG: hypothetical protein Ct9H90mP27_1780 [Gammaproteobacteria bacterium]